MIAEILCGLNIQLTHNLKLSIIREGIMCPNDATIPRSNSRHTSRSGGHGCILIDNSPDTCLVWQIRFFIGGQHVSRREMHPFGWHSLFNPTKVGIEKSSVPKKSTLNFSALYEWANRDPLASVVPIFLVNTTIILSVIQYRICSSYNLKCLTWTLFHYISKSENLHKVDCTLLYFLFTTFVEVL